MTYKNYIIGFVLSLLLTIVAYIVAVYYPTHSLALWILGAFALTQLAVQLTYFLHLGEEVRPKLRQMSFWFMATTLVIVVVGSIWIMANLNYNMTTMSSEQKTEYMLREFDKGF